MLRSGSSADSIKAAAPYATVCASRGSVDTPEQLPCNVPTLAAAAAAPHTSECLDVDAESRRQTAVSVGSSSERPAQQAGADTAAGSSWDQATQQPCADDEEGRISGGDELPEQRADTSTAASSWDGSCDEEAQQPCTAADGDDEMFMPHADGTQLSSAEADPEAAPAAAAEGCAAEDSELDA